MPTPAMLTWARELQVGGWYMLDYRGRNEVGATRLARHAPPAERCSSPPHGRGILFQQHRLAAFLQAGLLVPAQDESLTVRATPQRAGQARRRSVSPVELRPRPRPAPGDAGHAPRPASRPRRASLAAPWASARDAPLSGTARRRSEAADATRSPGLPGDPRRPPGGRAVATRGSVDQSIFFVDEELVENRAHRAPRRAPEDHQHDDLQVFQVHRAARDGRGAVDHHRAWAGAARRRIRGS